MKPEIFRIPGVDLPIHGYGLMIVIGFLLAARLASREARKRGQPDVVYDLGVVMLLTGLLGGRVFYYIQFYRTNFADVPWHKFFAIWEGGLVFYGGAIGGAIGGFIFLRLKRAPIAGLLDTIAPYVPIGMGFGRIGCFMNGCCYGQICAADFPLGVRFPRTSGAFDHHHRLGLIPEGANEALPVYPVQLFEAGADFVLCGLLIWFCRGAMPRGGGIPLLFALYAGERFLLELLRGDHWPVRFTSTGLTVYQNVSMILFLVFGAVFVVCWLRGVRPGLPKDGSKVGER